MKRTILLLLAIIGVALITLPQQTYAFDIFNSGNQGVNCSQGTNNDSAVCNSKTSNDPLTGTNGLIIKITRIIAYIAGAAAIIVILIGSIKFITASGDANQVSSARRTVINAIIGLAVIALAQTIIIFVVRRI